MSSAIRLVRVRILGVAVVAAVLALAAFASHSSHTEAAEGGINIDAYCQYRFLGSARAQLVPPYNVYSWVCRYIGGQAYGINLNDACKWQYGRWWASAAYRSYWNPYSWYCRF